MRRLLRPLKSNLYQFPCLKVVITLHMGGVLQLTAKSATNRLVLRSLDSHKSLDLAAAVEIQLQSVTFVCFVKHQLRAAGYNSILLNVRPGKTRKTCHPGSVQIRRFLADCHSSRPTLVMTVHEHKALPSFASTFLSIYKFKIKLLLLAGCLVPIKGSNGRAMAQAVSRWPLTAESRVRARVNPCEI
jgi:hypothetical protein